MVFLSIRLFAGATEFDLPPSTYDSFRSLLNLSCSFLKPEGHLFVAIENKYGLKYLQGCPETILASHMMASMVTPFSTLRHTFSIEELTSLLTPGYKLNLFVPLPDYKFPKAVVSIHDNTWDNRLSGLVSSFAQSDNIPYKNPNFWPELAHYELSQNSFYHIFANSFILDISALSTPPLWPKNHSAILKRNNYSTPFLITSHSTSNQLVLNSPDQKITFSDGIPLDICLSSCFRRSHFTKKQGLILILRRLKENLDEQFSSNKLNLDYLYDITASNILLDNSFNLIDIDTGLVCNFQRSSLSTFYTIRMLFHYVRKHRRSLLI